MEWVDIKAVTYLYNKGWAIDKIAELLDGDLKYNKEKISRVINFLGR